MMSRPDVARTTLKSEPTQIWNRIDLDPFVAAAWSESLHRQETSIYCMPTVTLESVTAITHQSSSVSGWIIGCSPERYPQQSTWLRTYRSRHPDAVFIGWGPGLAIDWQCLFLEAGVMLWCGGYEALPHIARLAVSQARPHFFESDPLVIELQKLSLLHFNEDRARQDESRDVD